jgi:hypothetical protein
MPGVRQSYYTRWRSATRERLDPRLLELTPPLSALCPPAAIIDKTRYSVVTDHTKTTDDLAPAADASLPTAMDSSQQNMLDKLKGLSLC